jgi:hypothetical protein
MRSASEARAERLANARARERKVRTGTAGAFRVNKRTKVVGSGEASGSGTSGVEKGEDQFLPEDKQDEEEEDGVYLSKEVRDLMAK